ncbi:MAG: hypothetical protein ACRETW_15940, partial [Stenotrophobium sp.]
RRYRGREWLLPVCALGTFLYIAVQQQGVVEARFRLPIDPIFVAALILLFASPRPRPGEIEGENADSIGSGQNQSLHSTT